MKWEISQSLLRYDAPLEALYRHWFAFIYTISPEYWKTWCYEEKLCAFAGIFDADIHIINNSSNKIMKTTSARTTRTEYCVKIWYCNKWWMRCAWIGRVRERELVEYLCLDFSIIMIFIFIFPVCSIEFSLFLLFLSFNPQWIVYIRFYSRLHVLPRIHRSKMLSIHLPIHTASQRHPNDRERLYLRYIVGVSSFFVCFNCAFIKKLFNI